jgi:hypothetical protein
MSTRIPSLLPKRPIRSSNGHGRMRPLENAHLVQLDGTPYEMGFAHGYLLADQIIDWFIFYQFQYNMGSNITYFNQYRSWLQENQHVEESYREEAKGMVDGMKASGAKLYLDQFSRDFDTDDVFIINSYLEASQSKGAMSPGPFASSHTSAPACSQFVAWDRLTVDGETLTGRNMDGETDPEFVTVTHLIVFAVTPSMEGSLRYVSVMWPGHIGTLSAVNEDGFSAMLNCGTMGEGSIAANITAIEWTIREIVRTSLAQVTDPTAVFSKFGKYLSSEGGVSAAGSVIVFARPVIKRGSTDASDAPGFIAEVDRYGGIMRVAPSSIPAVYQSNHFLSYGVDASTETDVGNPERNFNESIGFSSRWRLQAIRSAVESINRTVAYNDCTLDGLTGDRGVPRIMRASSHGATEHSIAVSPGKPLITGGRSKPTIAVANSKPWRNAGMWDGPYNEWIEYPFEGLFRHD